MTPEERLKKIEELRRQLHKLQLGCPHSVKPQQPDEYFGYGYAKCEGCSEDFGWYCPASPDHTCHYSSYLLEGRRVVILIDGSKHPVPQGHDPQDETDDGCIFCGQPEERQ